MLFTSCTKDELAPQLLEDVLASDRSPVAKPFKGDYIANVKFVGQEGPVVTIYIEAEGNATHIGNSTFVGIQYVDYSNNTLEGDYIMTAANGDRFWGTYDTDADEGGTNPDGSVYFSGTMYVDGGDGRFEGADGELPYYGGAGIGTGWFVFHDGILIY